MVESQIFFFGSSNIGFNCYPKSSLYNNYYSNSRNISWVYDIKQFPTKSIYTFVKYGLLTKEINGRTGSCFGISIELENHTFIRPKLLLNLIQENILSKIELKGSPIKRNQNSDYYNFAVNKISDDSDFLDAISNDFISFINKNYTDFHTSIEEIAYHDLKQKTLKANLSTSETIIGSKLKEYAFISISEEFSAIEKNQSDNKKRKIEIVKDDNLIELKGENKLLIISELENKKNETPEGKESNVKEPSFSKEVPHLIKFLKEKRLQIFFSLILFNILFIGYIFWSKNKSTIDNLQEDISLKTKTALPEWVITDKKIIIIKSKTFLNNIKLKKVKNINDFKEIFKVELNKYFQKIDFEIIDNQNNFKRISNFIKSNQKNVKQDVLILNNLYWLEALGKGGKDPLLIIVE